MTWVAKECKHLCWTSCLERGKEAIVKATPKPSQWFNVVPSLVVKTLEFYRLCSHPVKEWKRMWMPGRHSKRDLKSEDTLCPCKAVRRPGVMPRPDPKVWYFVPLGMPPVSFLPTGELLTYPVLGTVMGCSDLVETRLIHALPTGFPTTCTVLL